MEFFAGLDVSMAETQICVVAQGGGVIHKAKVPSTPADIAAELARVPACRRIVFETGRMAPMLYHRRTPYPSVQPGFPSSPIRKRLTTSCSGAVSISCGKSSRCMVWSSRAGRIPDLGAPPGAGRCAAITLPEASTMTVICMIRPHKKETRKTNEKSTFRPLTSVLAFVMVFQNWNCPLVIVICVSL